MNPVQVLRDTHDEAVAAAAIDDPPDEVARHDQAFASALAQVEALVEAACGFTDAVENHYPDTATREIQDFAPALRAAVSLYAALAPFKDNP